MSSCESPFQSDQRSHHEITWIEVCDWPTSPDATGDVMIDLSPLVLLAKLAGPLLN